MAITLKDLEVKLFTDGADKAQISEMAKLSWIDALAGLTLPIASARVAG